MSKKRNGEIATPQPPEEVRRLLEPNTRAKTLELVYESVYKRLNLVLPPGLPYELFYRKVIDSVAEAFDLSHLELVDLGRYLSERESYQ